MHSQLNQPKEAGDLDASPDPCLVVTEDTGVESSLEVVDHRYELLSLLGEGGMGSVYKVRDRELGKIFALKFLRPELVPDKFVMKRFEQEIQAESSLSHANLVTIYAHGKTTKGVPYFVMDYVPGESLATILKREGRLEAATAIDIFIQICDGLIHAHQKGMVHRDLKPGNIILAKTETGANLVKIVDFGIVKIVAEQKEQRLTQTEEIFGSPQYMSPEQCQGDKLDARSDIYSMGCLMYETITGRAPFASESPMQVIIQQVNEQPEPPIFDSGDRRVNARLRAMIMRCLEKNPWDRYQSTQSLERDLHLLQVGRRPSVDFYAMFRKLTTRSLWSNLLLSCLLIPTIAFFGFVIAYRHDLVWFLQYQYLTSLFSEASPEQYLALLKVSDNDTVPNVLFKLAGAYTSEAQKSGKKDSQANQQLDRAISLLQRSGKNNGLLVQCLRGRATYELDAGHVELADQYIQQAVQAAQSLKPNVEIPEVRFVGNWYCSSSFDPADLATTLETIAQAYDNSGKTAKADAAYNRAIQLISKWDQRPNLDPLGMKSFKFLTFAKLQEHYSEFCQRAGNKTKSRQLTLRALGELEKLQNDAWGKADEWENIGALALERGDPPVEAERVFRRALKARTAESAEQGPLNDSYHVAVSMALLADALSAEQRYGEAEREYRQAIAMMQKESPFGVEDIAERFAKSYWQQHRMREAIEVLRFGLASNHSADAILHHRPPNKKGSYAVPDEAGYQQLAEYLLQSGNVREAAVSFSDVVTISQNNGSELLHQAKVMEQYAACLRKLNEHNKANGLVKRAQQLRAQDKKQSADQSATDGGDGT